MEVKPLTKLIYKGKELTYDQLKRTSQIKFDVQCPTCGMIYETRKQYLEEKGSVDCQKCRMTKRFSKPLYPGEVYNYWTVLEESSQNHYYTCKCKCGTVKVIKGTLIRTGQIKSCGCLRKKKKADQKKEELINFLENNSGVDLVEPIYFRGKPIKYDDLKPQSNITIKIRCSACKKEFETSKYRLTSNGHYKCQTCAIVDRCAKHLPIGSRYGRWVVIDNKPKTGCAKCRCDCGTIKIVDNYALTSGESKSCGCLQIELARERAFETFNAIWEANKGVPLDIDPRSTKGYEYWREFILARDKRKCVRCGSNDRLNAHHIIAVKKDPSLALDPRNGVCLCHECHYKLHRIYKISASRETTNLFIKEINSDFELDECTSMHPEVDEVTIGTRKAYKFDELLKQN